MTVKELIIKLLDCDSDKDIALEYPTESGRIVGNYCRYEETVNFEVKEYGYGVIIGAE